MGVKKCNLVTIKAANGSTEENNGQGWNVDQERNASHLRDEITKGKHLNSESALQLTI